MALEWGAAVLAAGAVASVAAGTFMLRHRGAAAPKLRRRAVREHVWMRVTGVGAGGERTARLIAAWGAAVLLFAVAQLVTGKGGLALAVAAGGLMVPGWLAEWQETRRLAMLGDQLGKVMSLIATSLRRGTPLEGAIAEASLPLAAPLGPVLRLLSDAMVMGITLSQAVEQLRDHPAVANSADFNVFSTELVVCHQRGANVIQAFEALRNVLVSRRKYRELVREHMGQHVLQSIVISVVGLVVLVVFSQMGPEGLGPLLESVVGQIILAFSLLANVALIRVSHVSLLRQTRRV